jgi:hypothetical protein
MMAIAARVPKIEKIGIVVLPFQKNEAYYRRRSVAQEPREWRQLPENPIRTSNVHFRNSGEGYVPAPPNCVARHVTRMLSPPLLLTCTMAVIQTA